MSANDHPGKVILARHFVRKAMGLEIELEITEHELGQLWAAHQELHIAKVETSSKKPKEPEDGEADINVDGVSMNTNWAEPAWDSTKKEAVRKVMACLMNDAKSLPQIGRRIDRMVRQVGTVDIYFDDGSFVSAQVSDPQPRTSEEQAVVESIYGAPAPAKSCGCKKASCVHTAAPEIDMVAAMHRNELLGAMDARKYGAKDGRFWSYKIEGPFQLFHLQGVPMADARMLTDFPTRTTRLRNPKHAWSVASRYVSGAPFKRVSR